MLSALRLPVSARTWKRTWANRSEDNIGDLHDSLRAWCADPDDRRRHVCILERGAFTGDDRPRLADHLGPRRDGDRRRDNVRPSIKEDNFTPRELNKSDVAVNIVCSALARERVRLAYLVKYCCNSGGIIGHSITLCAVGFNADELARGVCSILRMRASKYLAGGV